MLSLDSEQILPVPITTWDDEEGTEVEPLIFFFKVRVVCVNWRCVNEMSLSVLRSDTRQPRKRSLILPDGVVISTTHVRLRRCLPRFLEGRG